MAIRKRVVSVKFDYFIQDWIIKIDENYNINHLREQFYSVHFIGEFL